MTVRIGLERLLAAPRPLIGKRVGLLTHQAGVTRDLRRSIDVINAIDGCELVRIFGPEHGMWGVMQDMEGDSSERDEGTGVELRSLYQATTRHDLTREELCHAKHALWPRKAWLADIDLLLVDLQDVGARYYTFVNTMAYCMEVATKTGTEIVVLDRPNPINGIAVEGNLIDPEWYSFVGQFPIPVRHGMTIGELARMYRDVDPKYACKLTVIDMDGWERRMWWDQTGLPWIAPSPNMPTLATATVYPGMCLVEATKLSEARGTTLPFELIGAPDLDAFKFAEELNALYLRGVVFRPQLFKPMFQKQAGTTCGGVQLHVTDRNEFQSYRVGLWCLKVLHDLLGDRFQWRDIPYEYEPADEKPAINLLTGNGRFKHVIDEGSDLTTLTEEMLDDEERFLKMRREYLAYS